MNDLLESAIVTLGAFGILTLWPHLSAALWKERKPAKPSLVRNREAATFGTFEPEGD